MKKLRFGIVLICVSLLAGCSSAADQTDKNNAETVENKESLKKEYSIEDQQYENIKEQYDITVEEDHESKYVCAYEHESSFPTFKIYVKTSDNDQMLLEMYSLQENELMYCYGQENCFTIYAVDSQLNYFSGGNDSIEDSQDSLTKYMNNKNFTIDDIKGALIQYYTDQD